jgi:hypothetical protein
VTYSVLGDGTSTLFWEHAWLNGCSIPSLAPDLVAVVPVRKSKQRTVATVFENDVWIADITGVLMVPILIQYLRIRQLV